MSWTRSDYPAEMKYLPLKLRNKAITIANSLLKETRMQERAVIRAAISRARKLSGKRELKQDTGLKGRETDHTQHFKNLSVFHYRNGWAIRVEMSATVHEIFRTKKEAVKQGRREVHLTGATLTIYNKDGSIEKQVGYKTPGTRRDRRTE